MPPALAEPTGGEGGTGSPAKDPNAAFHVPESEQAELLACWADSVFLKFRWASVSVRDERLVLPRRGMSAPCLYLRNHRGGHIACFAMGNSPSVCA